MVRGIRGATTVEQDDPDLILAATAELLEKILEGNPGLATDDIASILFTVTDDIISIHPAAAARKMGWNNVPLLCSTEIPVTGSLPLCVRVLIHWNTDLAQSQVKHIYLNEAVRLRPDLSK